MVMFFPTFCSWYKIVRLHPGIFKTSPRDEKVMCPTKRGHNPYFSPFPNRQSFRRNGPAVQVIKPKVLKITSYENYE